MNKNRMTIYRWNGHTCNKSSKTLEKTQRHQRSIFHSARRSSSSAAVSAWPPCRYCWRDRQHNGQLRWGWFFTVEKEALETNRQPLCLDMFGQFGLIICCFLIPWDIFVSGWTSKLIGKIMWHQQCKFGMEWDRNWSFNVCVTQEFFGLVAMISFGKRLMLMINWHPLPVSKQNAYPVLYKMKSFRSFLLAYFWKSQH